MTIKEARAILDKNNNIAGIDNLKFVTAFQKDMMSGEIVYTTIFSNSSYEALAWADRKAEMLKKFNVPFMIYQDYHLRESFGILNFERTEE